MEKKADIVVIGGGPGGYVAAIRLGQLGKKVVLVERDKLGGTCLNYGCIPTKALLSVAKLVRDVKAGEKFGLKADVSLDFQKLQSWKDRVVKRLRGGVEFLCKSNGVEVIHGNATLLSPNLVEVKTEGGSQRILCDNIVIATGSRPIEISSIKFDGKRILDSSQILDIEVLPKSLTIIGGGVIGVEIATIFASFGTEVTIVELMNQILPGVSKDVVKPVEASLKKLGVKLYLSSKAVGYTYTDNGVELKIETNGKEEVIKSEYVLVAVGRRPNTEGLNLEKIGVELDQKGFIKVNNRLETSVPGIYAIGDVIGQPMLAHKAMYEGVAVAEIIAGVRDSFEKHPVPLVVYSDPEIAIVGLSEEEAEQLGYEVTVGTFPFSASGRALTLGESDGFVKIVGDKVTEEVLGVQIVGPHASELIAEGVLAITAECILSNIASTIHPHPTLSEAVMEAAHAALGHGIHYVSPRK